MMKQVREATIEEVTQIAKEDFGISASSDFVAYIENLPTDRIKTEK